MDVLKMISILLPVLVALSGAGFYLYGIIQEPNFNNGKYYTTAWIEYGVNQNTLNIEFSPDLEGGVLLATKEALLRVEAKADINPKIDGKPLLIIVWIRNKTVLVEGGRLVLTAGEIKLALHGSPVEKIDALDNVLDKAEITFKDKYIMVQQDGKIKFVPRNNTTLDSTDKVFDEFLEHHYGEDIGYA